jgi:hypothetical protein
MYLRQYLLLDYLITTADLAAIAGEEVYKRPTRYFGDAGDLEDNAGDKGANDESHGEKVQIC